MFVCWYVYMLPFFSEATEPFALKFGTGLQCHVGQTAKQFGAEWMHHLPKTGPKRGQNGAQNA